MEGGRYICTYEAVVWQGLKGIQGIVGSYWTYNRGNVDIFIYQLNFKITALEYIKI